MALIDSDSYRTTGYFEEPKLPAVHLGEEAKIYLLGGSPALRGHVESIARGITDRDNTGGPELLVNPNLTFEWVGLAQRIPVRIHIGDVPEGVLVSSGMTCTVVLEPGRLGGRRGPARMASRSVAGQRASQGWRPRPGSSCRRV